MEQQLDAFEVVRSWWGSKQLNSDTGRMGINPSTHQGAFESLILGVLYSINGTGPDIKNTLDALRNNGYTQIEFLARISPNSADLDKIYRIFKQNYFHGRLALYPTRGEGLGGKIIQIIGNAKDILADQDLRGDIRKLYSVCGGDGHKVIQRLWKLDGIKKKAFWLTREMRMGGVWGVDGRYCCVPDKQVGASLERWKKIKKWPENGIGLSLCLMCSEIVWNSFGELYDVPILQYARAYKCNNKTLRRCANCNITICKDR
jgi:hypothetical protein